MRPSQDSLAWLVVLTGIRSNRTRRIGHASLAATPPDTPDSNRYLTLTLPNLPGIGRKLGLASLKVVVD